MSMALLNLGGGEIILILVLLFFLGVLALGFLGLVYLIVRAVLNRRTPAVAAQPPDAQNQERRDIEQIKVLAIFHFVFASLALVGTAFLAVHYVMMHTVFANPEMWKSQHEAPPPKAFFDAFIWFYVFMGVFLVIGLILNALSGFFLLRKRNRLFSIIIAGLDCLQIPFGTVLGVFTLILLSRDSVRHLYAGETPQASSAREPR